MKENMGKNKYKPYAECQNMRKKKKCHFNKWRIPTQEFTGNILCVVQKVHHVCIKSCRGRVQYMYR